MREGPYRISPHKPESRIGNSWYGAMTRLRMISVGIIIVIISAVIGAIFIIRSANYLAREACSGNGGKASPITHLSGAIPPEHVPGLSQESHEAKYAHIIKPLPEDLALELRSITSSMSTTEKKHEYLLDRIIMNPLNANNDSLKLAALELLEGLAAQDRPAWLNARLRNILAVEKGILPRLKMVEMLARYRKEPEDYQTMHHLLFSAQDSEVRRAVARGLRGYDPSTGEPVPATIAAGYPDHDGATITEMISSRLKVEYDPSVRADIASILAKLAPDHQVALEIFKEWWDLETEPGAKSIAAIELGSCRDPVVIEWCCRKINVETNQYVRSALAFPIIMSSGGENSLPHTRIALSNLLLSYDYPSLQYRALQLLGDYGEYSHIDLVNESMRHFKEPFVLDRAGLTKKQIISRMRK